MGKAHAMSQWIMLDFTCPDHGDFEELWDKREGEPVAVLCECGQSSPKVAAYALSCTMKLGEVTQGKNDTEMPPHIMSTKELADGMPMSEWKAGRAKKRQEERRAWSKKQVS